MKTNAPFPVTPDNIVQCWEFVDNCRRKARRKSAVARLGGYVTMQLFLMLLLFLVNGLVCDRLQGSYCTYLKGLPVFLPLWETVSGFLLKTGDSLTGDVIRLVVFAYVVSALVFCVLAGLICLLYHPKKKPVPEGDFPEITAALEKSAREARDYACKSHIATSVPAVVITIASAFLLLFAYMFQLQNAAVVTQALSRFPFKDVAVNCLLYVLAGYLVCEWLGSVLLLITWPVYRYDFPMEYLVQTQAAALKEKEPQLDAEKLRNEAIALEKEGSYNSACKAFRKAAILGDSTAMEHYGRHCLLNHIPDSARFWLNKSAATGNKSSELKKMQLRMMLRMHHNVEFLKPDQAPVSTGRKVLGTLGAGIKLLWRLLVLALLVVSIWVLFLMFRMSTDPNYHPELPAGVSVLLERLQDAMNQLDESADAYIQEEANPRKVPAMTLSTEGTRWENNCVLYDENRQDVVFCYGKDQGGDLKIPFFLEAGQKIQKATVFTGNKYDLRSVKKHISHIPETQTLVIAEDYLMGREPGECFIILDDSQYIPILVTELTDYATSQRGLAAQGNHNGWILNDLEQVQDLVLSFYNLGSDTITQVFETRQLSMFPNPTETELDSSACSVSEDGHSIILHADYLGQQEVGSYFNLKLALSSGEILNINHPRIGTVQGDFDGLMEISGKDTYSLSKDGDLVLTYSFGLKGLVANLNVSTDSVPELIAENLMGLTSDYIDFDRQTITIPEDLLKTKLSQDESIHIGISYTTAFDQWAYGSFHIQVVK